MIKKMPTIIKFDIFDISLSELKSFIKCRIVRLAQFANFRAVQAAKTYTRVATSKEFWAWLIARFVIARFGTFSSALRMLTTYFARLCAQIANFFTNFSALTVRALSLA
jgi:hypothetical protein